AGADGAVTFGGVVSCTVTVKTADAWSLTESVAVQFTDVSPSENVDPELGEQMTASVPSSVSVAVGSGQLTTAPDGPVASATVGSEGMPLITGVSATAAGTARASAAIATRLATRPMW